MLAHQEVLGHGTRKDEDIRPGHLAVSVSEVVDSQGFHRISQLEAEDLGVE